MLRASNYSCGITVEGHSSIMNEKNTNLILYFDNIQLVKIREKSAISGSFKGSTFFEKKISNGGAPKDIKERKKSKNVDFSL